MSTESDSLFETKQWFGKTVSAIEILGKKLGVENNLSDYFPLRPIVLKLEQYISYLAMLPNVEIQENRDNKLHMIGMFEKLRIQFTFVVEIYFAILIDARKDSAILQLQLLWTIVLLIKHWLDACLRYSDSILYINIFFHLSFHLICRNQLLDAICISKVKNGEVKLWLDNAGKFVGILNAQLYENYLHDISSIVTSEMERCKMSVREILASR